MNERVVDHLDLESLEPGIHRLWLEMASDALARPVAMPVLVARGKREGPVLGLTAAVHGNELNGIPVVHRLFRKLDMEAFRGTLVAIIVVNVPAFQRRQRRFLESQDLNHVFPGRPDGTGAQVWVHRLLDRAVRHFDVLVDLHTASFGRVNSLYIRADMTDVDTARMAYLQRPEIIVHNPPSDLTLRGAAAELGIPAITVEIGNPQRYQRDYIQRAVIGLRSLLVERKMIRKRPVVAGTPPVLCEASAWMYTDAGGLLEVHPKVTEEVEHGEHIATLTDPFGTVLREYAAPWSGIVIGRSVDPVAETGARIVHLGRIASPNDARFQRREEES